MLAYDQVFEALSGDRELIRFLSRKAKELGLANPKTSFARVQRNIEERILGDALRNPAKIQSNYPRADVARAVIKTVLSWPETYPRVLWHRGNYVLVDLPSPAAEGRFERLQITLGKFRRIRVAGVAPGAAGAAEAPGQP